jgi:N-acetylmuramoyl-L-alanine amidase
MLIGVGLAGCGGGASRGDEGIAAIAPANVGPALDAAASAVPAAIEEPAPEATPTLEATPAPEPSPQPSPDPAPDPGVEAPVRTLVIDPGHGGPGDPGAARGEVVEKHSNLDMARRVRALLEPEGVRVVFTREEDGPPLGFPDPAPAGYSAARLDVQARVDTANAADAQLFLAIHSNGSSNAGERGVEVWYDGLRPFADRNELFASLLLANVLEELNAAGYPGGDRGIKDDRCWRVRQDRCFQIFVIGPERETKREDVLRRGGDPAALGFEPGQDVIMGRATAMPGALVELLFISNDFDNEWLRTEIAREAMARGLVRAVLAYFADLESR